jgi:hypothetical protein
MQIINIPTMKGMISHLGIAKQRPLFFHGPSGIGKSEGVQQSCEEHEGIMCDIRVSQYESIDFRGIPDVKGNETVWNMPATLPFKGNGKFALVSEDKPIYLFLDELNQGDPSVMSVCYQLINDRRIGEHQLMDNVVMIAAGNRAADKGTTNRFPAPLANRMTHAELTADIKSWSKWAAGAGVSPTLIGFLNFRDGLLTTFDPAKPTTVFATPRTWSFVSEDFEDDSLPADVKIAALAGSVGEGPATELQGFIKIMASLQPIEQIIANPTKVPVSSELDVQWAMATHVAGHMTEETVEPLSKFLNRLEAEMVVMAWTIGINKNKDLTDTNAFLYDYAPKYRGLFQN